MHATFLNEWPGCCLNQIIIYANLTTNGPCLHKGKQRKDLQCEDRTQYGLLESVIRDESRVEPFPRTLLGITPLYKI